MSSQAASPDNDALPVGTRLGEFEIERVIGVGGFGIVYLALDHALQRRVALKEYMPSALAARGNGTEQVSIRSSSHAETFGIGLRSFVNEARLLARFDNPALVKVHRFWEANGTAYMAMPYYQGVTLKEARPALGGAPGEAWLRTLLDSVLGALELIHHEQIYHRDVSPPNIMLVGAPAWERPRELRPVLLDFGAARHVIGDRTQTLTAILNPSFAPIEQYAESSALRQGPWTDLYALAGVVYFCLTGRPPVQAAARTIHDEQRSLSAQQGSLRSVAGEPYSLDFLRAIDWCLSVKPNQRPDSVQTLREALSGQRPIPAHVAVNAAAAGMPDVSLGMTDFPPTQPAPGSAASDAFAPTAFARTEADQPTRVLPTTGSFAAPASAAQPEPLASAGTPAPAVPPAPAAPSAPSAPGSGRAIGMGAAAALVVLAAGFAVWRGLGAPGGATAAPVVTPDAATPATATPVTAMPVTATTPPVAVPQPPSRTAPALVAPQAAVAVQAARPAEPSPTSGPRGAIGATGGVRAAKADHAGTPAGNLAVSTAVTAHAAPGAEAAVVPSTPTTPAAQPETPAPAPTPGPEAARPPEVCSKRVLFAYDLCMTRECKKPQYAGLPQCGRFITKPVDPTDIHN